jgi:hypothetical protein
MTFSIFAEGGIKDRQPTQIPPLAETTNQTRSST